MYFVKRAFADAIFPKKNEKKVERAQCGKKKHSLSQKNISWNWLFFSCFFSIVKCYFHVIFVATCKSKLPKYLHCGKREREVLAVLLFPSFYINKQKRKWSYLTWKTQMDVGTWKRKVSRTDETVLEIGRYILTKDCSLTSQKLVGICNKTHILLQWDLEKKKLCQKKIFFLNLTWG